MEISESFQSGEQEMAKKKSTIKKTFKSPKEMDEYLEGTDLAPFFAKDGVLKKSNYKKINLDLPEWLLKELDAEAERAGVARQPLIKIWLVQKLEEERKKRA
jgi:hypothetical protein